MPIIDLSGMGGLIKRNLIVYFDSRKNGADHYDALLTCLSSRYRFEPSKVHKVMPYWRGVVKAEADYMRMAHIKMTKPPTKEDVEKDELRYLLQSMYIVEAHLDQQKYRFKRLEETERFDGKFNRLYDSIKTKYL